MAHPEAQPLAFDLKPISSGALENALEKAEHYRLLNQPHLAESICLDVLAVDAVNQKALIILLLAMTDQFDSPSSRNIKKAMDIASRLRDEYSRNYYRGIVLERQAAATLKSGVPSSNVDACEWFLEAMKCYEKAESLSLRDNNDAVLRWNTCARAIMQHNLKQRPIEEYIPVLE
ncbi:MAG TPA: hypothetical protein VGD65_21175 [Chryseosolibacter sp.]